MDTQRRVDLRIRIAEVENPRLYAKLAAFQGHSAKHSRGALVRRLLDQGLLLEEQRELQDPLPSPAARSAPNEAPSASPAIPGQSDEASKAAMKKAKR